MANSVNLDSVRSVMDQNKRKFNNDQTSDSDYLVRPSWPYFIDPWEKKERLVRSGDFGEYDHDMDIVLEAADLKRSGDLVGANRKYMTIETSGTKLMKDHLWPWCKVLILAKSFDDLKYLVEYLYAFNARFNRLCKEVGNNQIFDAYRQYGNEPPMGYSCDAGYYLRSLCESALASKDEIEWRFAQYGGSDRWSNYALTATEFDSFKRCFGMP